MFMGRLLFVLVIICTIFASFSHGKDLMLFTDEEAARLSFTEDEWQNELDFSEQKNVPGEDTWVDQIEGGSPGALQLNKQAPKTSAKRLEALSGPHITIEAPQVSGDRYLSEVPIRLLVFFTRSRYPIDIDSLEVNGRRGILSLNITGRIKKFLRPPKGGENAEFVLDGVIPKMRSGKYQIVLSLADTKGNRGVYKALLEVL